MSTDIFYAILAIDPNAKVKVEDDNVDTIEWQSTPIAKADILAKQKELKADYDAKKYQRDRKPLYPEIGDQLDDLYKQGAFSADMTAKIKKVKDDNPKP